MSNNVYPLYALSHPDGNIDLFIVPVKNDKKRYGPIVVFSTVCSCLDDRGQKKDMWPFCSKMFYTRGGLLQTPSKRRAPLFSIGRNLSFFAGGTKSSIT